MQTLAHKPSLTEAASRCLLLKMRRLGWCWLVATAACAACEGAREPAEFSHGAGGGGAGVSGEAAMIGIGGYPQPAAGGRPPADLGSVEAPLVHCHSEGTAGAPSGSAGANDSGEAPLPGAAGAPSDDDCSPPPSRCVDELTLVYFDQGECVASRCTWQKKSLLCQNQCFDKGCQDSITTK